MHTFDDTVVIGNQDGRTDHIAAAGPPVRLRLINTDSGPHWFALHAHQGMVLRLA